MHFIVALKVSSLFFFLLLTFFSPEVTNGIQTKKAQGKRQTEKLLAIHGVLGCVLSSIYFICQNYIIVGRVKWAPINTLFEFIVLNYCIYFL